MKLLLLFTVAIGLSAGVFYRAIFWMPEAELADARALPDSETREIASRLQRDVASLSVGIGERHHRKPEALNEAADYISQRLAELGFAVKEQQFGDGDLVYRNVYAELAGTEAKPKLLIIGAHYDTVPGSPGADDNASGVAVLLELAHLLKQQALSATLRFVAFTNEEQPFSHTELMGSRVHARIAREKGETIIAMISLESLGIYDDLPNSQHYPPLVRQFYPDRGNFLAFVGNLENRNLVHQAITSFRQSRRLPSQGIAAPQRLVSDITRSDHASFWANGFPAFMVTDTTNFRTPYYHQPKDLVENLDMERMALATQGLREVIIDLSKN